jgi:hypothetical protein
VVLSEKKSMRRLPGTEVMSELKPPPEHAHLQYHWLRDMRLTASDGLPFLEPMLWHNDLWWRIGGSNPLNGHHHWRYHGPAIPPNGETT